MKHFKNFIKENKKFERLEDDSFIDDEEMAEKEIEEFEEKQKKKPKKAITLPNWFVW